MTSLDAKAPEAHPTLTAHPILGVAGVLLGAMIATCTGRLMSVGFADIRGASHLGVDEASWMNTSFHASMTFIGRISVYLGGLLGPRAVLLACAWIVAAVSFLTPFCHSLFAVITLVILAGHRLFGLGHVFVAHSTGPTAVGRAAEVLGLQIRQQAFTLAISDSFLLVAACCVACLVVVALMSAVPTQYRQVVASPVEAK
jgi:hypothetical protein